MSDTQTQTPPKTDAEAMLPPTRMDYDAKPHPHTLSNRLARMLWGVVQATLFRLSPKPAHAWRNLLLRLFGADLHPSARVYPRARVWSPSNLTMGERATLADDVDCYCVAPIRVGARTTVSQYTYLCAATHDFEDPRFLLTPMPISVGEECWIAADVFVAPGVTIGDGAVVGARSSVFTDLPPWKICAGSPAKPLRDRVLRRQNANDSEPGANPETPASA